MRNITKFGVSAVMACGAAISTVAPAAAQVSFGIGVGPGYPAYSAPAYPSCYDAYGNYVYSYPYCTAYASPPVVQPYYGWDRDRDWWRHRDFDLRRDRDREVAMRDRERREHRDFDDRDHRGFGDRDRD